MHTNVTEQSAASIFRTALKGGNRTLRNIFTSLENYTGRQISDECLLDVLERKTYSFITPSTDSSAGHSLTANLIRNNSL